MSFPELRQQAQKLAEAPEMSVADLTAHSRPFRVLLGQLPIEEAPVIKAPQLARDSASEVVLAGSVDLFKQRDLDVELAFGILDGSQHAAFALAFPTSHVISLPGVPIEIHNLSFHIAVDGLGSVSGVFEAQFVSGEHRLPVAVTLPPEGGWITLRSNSPPRKLPSLQTMFEMIGAEELAGGLPDAFANVEGIGLDALSISFDGTRGTLASVDADLSIERIDLSDVGVVLSELHLKVAVIRPASSERDFYGYFHGAAELLGAKVDLEAMLSKRPRFRGGIERLTLRQCFETVLGDVPAQIPDIELEDAGILLDAGSGAIELEGAVTVDFSTLKSLGITLPVGIPNFSLSHAGIMLNPRNKSWSLELRAGLDLAFPAGSADGIQFRSVKLTVEKLPDEPIRVAMSLWLTGRTRLTEDWSLEVSSLTMSFVTDSGWEAAGRARLRAHGEHDLAITMAVVSGQSSLQLTYEGGIMLFDWPEIARAEVQHLDVAVAKLPDEGKGYQWRLSGSGRLSMPRLLGDVDLTLGAELVNGLPAVYLEASAPNVEDIVLPFPVAPPTLSPAIGALRMRVERTPEGKTDWAVGAAASLDLRNMPSPFDHILPSHLDGRLVLSKTRQALLLETPEGFDAELPALRLALAGLVFDLGRPELSFTELSLDLAEAPQFSAVFDASGLAAMNALFGGFELLNDRCAFALKLGDKALLQALSSPFKGVDIEQRDGRSYALIDAGQMGRFDVQVPEFSHDAGMWSASAGIQQKSELNLPLIPAKFLLELAGLPKSIVDVLPDWVPFKGLDLTSPRLAEDIGKLVAISDASVLEVLKDAIVGLQSFTQNMPANFGEYLNLRLPEGFELSAGAASGGANFSLATKGEPLRLLLPLGTPPGLVGITLHSADFGAVLGGSAATVRIDGWIDVFDITLLSAAALGKLDDSLIHRISLRETFMLLPSAFPVPLPLFFEELSWELKTPFGLGLKTGWAFPEPFDNLLDILKFAAALAPWFADRDYLLHEHDLREALPLTFKIGPNYLGLPSYLAGETHRIGYDGPELVIDVADQIARLLDGLKTQNLAYIIEGIPLKVGDQWIRLGHVDIKLGPFTLLEGAWCITTEREFLEIADQPEPRIVLGEVDANKLLAELPAPAEDEPRADGFVVLMMAGMGIDYVASSRLTFGSALTGSNRWVTDIAWTMTFIDVLELRIGGRFEAGEERLSIIGTTGLYLGDVTLAETEIGMTVTDRYCRTHLTIRITEYFEFDCALTFGLDGVELKGSATLRIDPSEPLAGIEAVGGIDKNGLSASLAGNVFGHRAKLVVSLGGRPIAPALAVEIEPSQELQTMVFDSVKSLAPKIRDDIDAAINDIASHEKDIDTLALSLDGIRETVASTLEKTARDLPGIVHRQVNAGVSGYISRLDFFSRNLAKGAWALAQGSVLADVDRGLEPYTGEMTTLADRLRRASPLEAKALLLEALDRTLARFETFTYTYEVDLTVKTFSYPYTYHMPETLKQTIREGREGLSQLDEKQTIVIDQSSLVEINRHKQALLDDIEKGIRDDVDKSAARVEFVKFDTELRPLAKGQKGMRLGLRQGEKVHEFMLDGNLTSLGDVVREGVERLLTELAE